MSSRKERFHKIYQASEPFRKAKKDTIHTLGQIGRKHRLLKYPILIGLVAFIFIYNLFLYTFIELKAEEKLAKGLALLMTVVLVFTSVDIAAFAMSPKDHDFYKVTDIGEMENCIEVPYGTLSEDIPLPKSVTAILERYTYEEAEEEAAEGEVIGGDTLAPSDETMHEEEQVASDEEVVENETMSGDGTVTENEKVPDNETVTENETMSGDETASEKETETVVTEETVTMPTYNAKPELTEEISALTKDEKVTEITTESTVTKDNEKVEKYLETIVVELPVTWKCDSYAEKVPGEYTFIGVLPEKYENRKLIYETEAYVEMTVKVSEAKAVHLSETVEGIQIELEALPGVFPENVSLSVEKVVEEKSLNKIETAIQSVLDEQAETEDDFAVVEKTITFDIKVLDSRGKEIQPEIPEGMSQQEAVSVTFKQVVPQLSTDISEEDEDAVHNMDVFYVDDSFENATQMESNLQGDNITFNPEHFSYYSCICYVTYPKKVTSWSALYKAIYNKSGTVDIKLGRNITIDKLTFYSNSNRIYIKNGQTVNLDLNGYDLRSNVSGKAAIEVTSGRINIHDTVGGGTISSANGSDVIYANGGEVAIYGGEIVKAGSESEGIYLRNGSKVYLYGGCISGSFTYGIYYHSSYKSTVVIDGGCISGPSYGVYIGGSSNLGSALTMNSGAITNCKYAGIYNNNGVLKINGGEISGNSSYKAYGIKNTGYGTLALGGNILFSRNRAADIYVGNTNYINVTSELTGSSIGVETATAPMAGMAVRFTENTTGKNKFYSAANSSYAVWQENGTSYLVVGPKENCVIKVQPFNKKDNTAYEDMAGTVAIGSGTGSVELIETTVKYNASVTLKATLTNTDEYRFAGWKNGEGTIVCDTPVYTFAAKTDETYTAVFEKKKVTISVTSANTGRGSVAITNYSLGTASGNQYEVGSTITIKATPGSVSSSTGVKYYRFVQWNDGNTDAERVIVVPNNVTNLVYTAQFGEPAPAANAIGEMFIGVKKVTSNPSVGTKLLLIGGGGSVNPSNDGKIAIAGLPADHARVVAVSNSTYSRTWGYARAAGVNSLDGSSGRQVTIQTKTDGSLYKGEQFDTCTGGAIAYYSPHDKWYYWCSGGAYQGDYAYNVYSYTSSSTYRAGDIKAKLNYAKISEDKRTVSELDITINIGEYEIKNLQFLDKTINYENGDRNIELDLGNVLFTYTLPEAIMNGKEYLSLEEALAEAGENDSIQIVGPAISEINVPADIANGVTIHSYDDTVIEAKEASTVKATADGTIELVSGTLFATPASENAEVTVDVKGASVTANEAIILTTNSEYGSAVTTTTDTAEITISPDGNPQHTVTYTTCSSGTTYGMSAGKLTNEEKVTITKGTEYNLNVQLGTDEKSIATDGANTGTTVISKGKDENDKSFVSVKSDAPNDNVTVGNSTYTTGSDNTELVLKEDSDDVVLKEGAVNVPKDGSITLPSGKKVTNESDEDSATVTVSSEGKVKVPDGSKATIGEGDNKTEISVPKETPANLESEVTLNEDGSLSVESKPGNKVTIGENTYTIGDYDTTFKVSTSSDEEGNSSTNVVVDDGGVVLQPGQSIVDSNGIKYENTGNSPMELTMTKGENTEVKLKPGESFTYTEAGSDEPIEYTNPGGTEATFNVSKEGDLSLGSNMRISSDEEITVDILDRNVSLKTPNTNQGNVEVNTAEGTITVEKSGDKVSIDNQEYTVSKDNTVLLPGNNGVELVSGGVKLKGEEQICSNTTAIKNYGNQAIEVTIEEDGSTAITVPENGGFILADPISGNSAIFMNPDDGETKYTMDGDGNLVLDSDKEISFTQNGKTTNVKADGEDITLSPTENGVEIKVPVGAGVIINGVTYENKSMTEELVISIDAEGNCVLQSGTAKIPEGQKLKLESGDVVTNGQGEVLLSADGSIAVKENGVVSVQTANKVNTYTAEDSDINIVHNPETGIPTLENGNVTLGKNSSIDVVYDTIVQDPSSELFDEEKKATIDNIGLQGATVKDDGTVLVPQNGSVEISYPKEENTVQHIVSVPKNAQNTTASLGIDSDGNTVVSLERNGDVVIIDRVEYTTAGDNTVITVTEHGSSLTSGAVIMDGGKTPGENINVNGTNVKNTGKSSSAVYVKANGDSTIGFYVSAGGEFELSVPDNSQSAVKFKNPGTSVASYTVQTDGSIELGTGSSITFVSNGKDITVEGGDGVSLEITNAGVAVTVEEGKEVTIDGVTYVSTGTEPLVLTVDDKGNVIVTEGKVKVSENTCVCVRDNDGNVVEIAKTGDDSTKGERDTIEVTSDGRIYAYPGDEISVNNGKYTSLDESGEFNLTIDTETTEVVVDNGNKISVKDGSVTFDDINVSTNGSDPVIVEKQNAQETPVVTVSPGGNTTITNKTTDTTVEIKLPEDTEESKNITLDNMDNILVELNQDEQVTVGGIIYTAQKDGVITVNGNGELISDTITEDGNTTTKEIDPESFNRENYQYNVPAGESIKVGDMIYTAPSGGMTLIGNENGNPIILVHNGGDEVKVGDITYVTDSDNTKFIVNKNNDISLIDNGNPNANSSIKVTDSRTLVVDGNRITNSGAEGQGYSIQKTANGDLLEVEDGTKLTINLSAKGAQLVLNEKVTYNGKETAEENVTIKAKADNTGIILDKTGQNEEEEYITKISAIGNTILSLVKDGDGNIVGFVTGLPAPIVPSVNPPQTEEEETENKTETEKLTNPEETIEDEDGNLEDPVDETFVPDEKQEDEKTVTYIVIDELEEAKDVEITGDSEVTIGKGKVNIYSEIYENSVDCNITGTLEQILNACFERDELEKVQNEGQNLGVRISVVKIVEEISNEEEKQAIQKQTEKLRKDVQDLMVGCYLEISVERRVGENDWETVSNLYEEVEFTLNVPDNLLQTGRTYFIMRNHDGKCELLEDLDREETTITFKTDKFSTYAILYTDTDVSKLDISRLNQTSNFSVWISIIGLAMALFVLGFVLYQRERKKKHM